LAYLSTCAIFSSNAYVTEGHSFYPGDSETVLFAKGTMFAAWAKTRLLLTSILCALTLYCFWEEGNSVQPEPRFGKKRGEDNTLEAVVYYRLFPPLRLRKETNYDGKN